MIFRFKQFSVSHANSSMKVGTDAVIIGSWADVKNSQTILDIGTGSGIIALMMAQKNSEAHIKAIDIDEDSIHEASQNFEQSAWSERLEAECIAFQNFGLNYQNHFVFYLTTLNSLQRFQPPLNLRILFQICLQEIQMVVPIHL